MIDLIPTNHSLQFLRPVWKECAIGAARYAVRHPISGWKILAARIRFPLLKTALPAPVETPEGFILKSNLELHLYCNIFVEMSLYHKPLVSELRRMVNPFILDVGGALGMASQWFTGINSTVASHCFEPGEMIVRARELAAQRKGPPRTIKFNRVAVSDCDGQATLYVGQGSSLRPINVLDKTEQVETVTLDSYMSTKQVDQVFCLKLDTDGSNAKVLAGAVETLKKTRWLLIEKERGIEEHLGEWSVVSESVEDLLYAKRDQSTMKADSYLYNR